MTRRTLFAQLCAPFVVATSGSAWLPAKGLAWLATENEGTDTIVTVHGTEVADFTATPLEAIIDEWHVHVDDGLWKLLRARNGRRRSLAVDLVHGVCRHT